MRTMSDGMLTAISARVVRPAVVVSVDSPDGPARLWSGRGDLNWNSQTWIGKGNFLSASPFTEVNQVQAAATTLTLSGVDPAQRAYARANIKRYRSVKIWMACFDGTGAMIADPILIRSSYVSSAQITDDPKSMAITIVADSRIMTLTRPRESRYTDQEQRRRYPTDAGFAQVTLLQNQTIVWTTPVNLLNT